MTPSRCRGRRAAAEAGVWQVLVRDETEELGPAIRNLTGGDGVDIVCDGSGKALFDVSIAILHFRGVFVHYGRAGGPIPPLDLGEQPDGVHLVRVRGDAAHESIVEWRNRALLVMQWIDDGALDVLIDRTYPPEDAAVVHRNLESQETVGKLLLLP